eukprot:2379427-Pleurochrysis_carterae.AAC.1
MSVQAHTHRRLYAHSHTHRESSSDACARVSKLCYSRLFVFSFRQLPSRHEQTEPHAAKFWFDPLYVQDPLRQASCILACVLVHLSTASANDHFVSRECLVRQSRILTLSVLNPHFVSRECSLRLSLQLISPFVDAQCVSREQSPLDLSRRQDNNVGRNCFRIYAIQQVRPDDEARLVAIRLYGRRRRHSFHQEPFHQHHIGIVNA